MTEYKLCTMGEGAVGLFLVFLVNVCVVFLIFCFFLRKNFDYYSTLLK